MSSKIEPSEPLGINGNPINRAYYDVGYFNGFEDGIQSIRNTTQRERDTMLELLREMADEARHNIAKWIEEE